MEISVEAETVGNLKKPRDTSFIYSASLVTSYVIVDMPGREQAQRIGIPWFHINPDGMESHPGD